MLCMARDLGYMLRHWYLYSYAYMVVWILTFVMHLSFLTDFLCSAWLGTTGMYFNVG